jgi:dCTP deaminase
MWEVPGGIQVKPGHSEYKYSSIARSFQKYVPTDGYVLLPSTFLLSWTREKLSLPINSRLAARVEGRSSLARLGIGIHLTAPTIHAWFVGPIQLEMFNFGQFEIVLNSGMKICQLILEQTMGTPQAGYTGQFFDQKP